MQVTNVRVQFLREKQPAQYEKAAPAVEFAAVLEDGDDHLAVALNLMTDATTVVYAGIGYDVPPRVAQALAGGKVPAELSVAAETKEVAEAAPETAEEAAEPKKTRGRPKGSKNTAPKKETAAAKRKREAKEAEAAKDTDGVPGDDEPKDPIRTGEERINPEDDVPGDDREEAVPTGDDEFTPKDLHTMIIGLVQATPRRLSVANAKQVLAHFKVARAQDLTDEQALKGKELVEEMLAETARQGS